MVEKDLKVIS